MWILMVFISCIITQTSGTCYDDHLSLYVTGDGNIRARLTAAAFSSASTGYIGKKCGLRCGCFAMVFLCCSDKQCIAMDHACPARHLHQRHMRLHSYPQVMDQSQFESIPESIKTRRFDPEVNPVQGQGRDVPALTAHAPPTPHEDQSPVYTDSTIPRNANADNVVDNEAFASAVRKTTASTSMTHNSQPGKKQSLKLIEVLKLMLNIK